MSKSRILIICNKSWETDALLSALLNDDIRSADFDYEKFKIKHLIWPWKQKRDQGVGDPRVVFETERYQFEIWCIQNIMTPNPNPADNYYYSRSIQKGKDFHKILDYHDGMSISLVVAFGTAGIFTEVSKNGNVVIGSNIFVYDASPELPPDQKFNSAEFGKLISSSVDQPFFDQLTINLSSLWQKQYFEKRVLTPPINAAGFQVFIDKPTVAISDVNVKSYRDYGVVDPAALAAYTALQGPTPKPITFSIETTHGLTRIETLNYPFLFVSAVTDRDAYFNNEVTPRASGQNFSASFNGGIVMSCLIPFIEKFSG